MVRRALTLLETLLVVAIIAAVFAIALPETTGLLAERRFREGAAAVTGHLRLARSIARADGEAVVVMYRHDDQDAWLEAHAPAEALTEIIPLLDGPLAADPADDLPSTLAGQTTDDPAPALDIDGLAADLTRPLPEAWATRRLPARIRLSRLAPDVDGSMARGADGSEIGAIPDRAAIAVFLPDGSAIVPGPIVVLGEGGRWSMLHIDALTGRIESGGDEPPAGAADAEPGP